MRNRRITITPHSKHDVLVDFCGLTHQSATSINLTVAPRSSRDRWIAPMQATICIAASRGDSGTRNTLPYICTYFPKLLLATSSHTILSLAGIRPARANDTNKLSFFYFYATLSISPISHNLHDVNAQNITR